MATNQDPSASDIPSLLRFLTQEAKIPLSKAMLCLKNLQREALASPAAIYTSNVETLTPLTLGVDDAKRVLNASRRIMKRASSSAQSTPSSTSTSTTRGKKRKHSSTNDEATPHDLEASLALPEPVTDLEVLRPIVVYTNRAPLLLAFAVVLLEYTMPGQPLSSRLSLAQAMVGAGAREKAVYLGLESGKSAEEEGFGMGQPVVKVMGRDVRVLKRWGYTWKGQSQDSETQTTMGDKDAESASTNNKVENEEDEQKQENKEEAKGGSDEPALWGLDLEALKKSNSRAASTSARVHESGLPIYTAQSARSYLLRSFASAEPGEGALSKTKTAKENTEMKERNVGFLLGALKVLYDSWYDTLDLDELSKRAWSWYVTVRPDVEHGIAGWGGKGQVRLAKLISLRKQ